MKVITTSNLAFRLLKPLGQLEVEEFWLLALHANKRVIGLERVFRGTVDACPVFPRDVFRAAIRLNASSVIVAHNHPSGDPSPSPMDYLVTERLLKGGELLGIAVDDHLIIADKRYWSFADRGEMSSSGSPQGEHRQRLDWADAARSLPSTGR